MISPDSIKAKIKNIAKKTNTPFDYLLMHYFVERLLYRLSISNYSEQFILKGGLLLYTILEDDARATKDIDFLARQIDNTPEDLVKVFAEIVAIPADDAVSFDISSISAVRIKEDADYQGIRIKVIGHLDKSRHILQFDIGFGNVVVPRPYDMEYPSLLDMESPKIKAYSKESVIAEKFEAMIYLAEANSRMKDFYDIYMLCRSFDFDGRVLYEAVYQTFNRRATPISKTPTVFSEAFPKLRDKQIQWTAFQKRIRTNLNVEFPEVMDEIKLFLEPVYDCILEEKEYFGNWKHKISKWD